MSATALKIIDAESAKLLGKIEKHRCSKDTFITNSASQYQITRKGRGLVMLQV